MRTVIVWLRCSVLFAGCFLTADLASADMIANPVSNVQGGHCEFGVVFGWPEVDYETDSWLYGEALTIDRRCVGLYAALGLADRVDVFLAASSITETENPEDYSAAYSMGGGDGFAWQLGLRGELARQGAFSAHAYGLFNHISEDYGDYYFGYSSGPGWSSFRTSRMRSAESPNVGQTEGTFQEWILGILAAFDISDVSLYGGLEAIVDEKSELDIAGVRQVDIERSDTAVGTLGVQFSAEPVWLRLEASLGGESGVTVGVGASF
jgi:hypothetical protein